MGRLLHNFPLRPAGALCALMKYGKSPQGHASRTTIPARYSPVTSRVAHGRIAEDYHAHLHVLTSRLLPHRSIPPPPGHHPRLEPATRAGPLSSPPPSPASHPFPCNLPPPTPIEVFRDVRPLRATPTEDVASRPHPITQIATRTVYTDHNPICEFRIGLQGTTPGYADCDQNWVRRS